MARNIVTRAKYGKIGLKFRERLDATGLNRNEFARMVDVRFEVVNKWYNSDTITRIDTDILAKMCYALECDISDLIEYIPDDEA